MWYTANCKNHTRHIEPAMVMAIPLLTFLNSLMFLLVLILFSFVSCNVYLGFILAVRVRFSYLFEKCYSLNDKDAQMSQIAKRVIHGVLRGRGSLPNTAGVLCFENDGLGGHFLWKSVNNTYSSLK